MYVNCLNLRVVGVSACICCSHPRVSLFVQKLVTGKWHFDVLACWCSNLESSHRSTCWREDLAVSHDSPVLDLFWLTRFIAFTSTFCSSLDILSKLVQMLLLTTPDKVRGSFLSARNSMIWTGGVLDSFTKMYSVDAKEDCHVCQHHQRPNQLGLSKSRI